MKPSADKSGSNSVINTQRYFKLVKIAQLFDDPIRAFDLFIESSTSSLDNISNS